jgi:ferredoxin-NADP reductase
MPILSNSTLLQGVGLILLAAVIVQTLLLLLRSWRQLHNQQQQQQLALELMQHQVETARTRHSYARAELESWQGHRKFVVADTVRESGDSLSVYLGPHDGHPLPVFRPGQHLVFRFNIPGEERPLNRCYSLSSAPNNDYYRITVKRLPPPPEQPRLAPGKVSNHISNHLKKGDILDVRAPKGDFYLDPGEQDAVVLIGGGIGITPFISMLMTLAGHGFRREVWLFYGVRSAQEYVFKSYLELLQERYPDRFHLNVFCSRDTSASLPKGYHQGRISLAFIRNTLPSNNFRFYVCGPPSMMQDIVHGLRQWRVPAQRISFEAFGAATIRQLDTGTVRSAPERARNTDCRIRFSRSARTLDWDNRYASLLEFGLDHGIMLESGCGAGECSTCEIAVKSGKVHYIKAPSEPPGVGNCRPCVCVPDSELLELDA